MSQAIETQGTLFYVAPDAGSPTNYQLIGEVVSFDGPTGQAKVIDVSHLTSTRREKRMGLPDEGQITLNLNYVPSDTGQDELTEARDNRELRNFKMVLAGAVETWTWQGFVLKFSINGGVDDKVNATAVIEITGAIAKT